MAEAKKGDTVKVHYTGILENGEQFDSSKGRDPLEFTIGNGQVIPGFENGVIGLNLGESKTVKIPPEEGYGPRYEEMVLKVDKSKFPEGSTPEIGQQLQLKQLDGKVFVVSITDIEDDSITLDANHPLAGKVLNFEIELVEIL